MPDGTPEFDGQWRVLAGRWGTPPQARPPHTHGCTSAFHINLGCKPAPGEQDAVVQEQGRDIAP